MIIHPSDNVEVLLEPRAIGGSAADGAESTAGSQNVIPAGHKVALRAINAGEMVIKYGQPIGHATKDIAAGEWIHSHNMETNLSGKLEYEYNPLNSKNTDDTAGYIIKSGSDVADELSFQGYLREDGRVGVRNELWIIPTVGCVSHVAERLAEEFQKRTPLTVRALKHEYGCSQLGGDHENTKKVLAALALHPNAGGVLVLGLGCENNRLSELKKLTEGLGIGALPRVRFLEAQAVDDEFAEGLKLLEELDAQAQRFVRTEQPLSKLCIGLKCGGSDGFSGITANPLLGRLSDFMTGSGASAVLTEVPEMFGAETLLMNRCVDRCTFDKTVRLINNFKQYYLDHGQPVGENPSPGNKEGGITTLEEKSLGCVQKGGTSVVTGVLDYAERVFVPGLNLLCAPGNDLVASTALAVSGCQIVLFTTGRGTPFGTCVPTLKVSTNSALALKKPHWIDFNAGPVLLGQDLLPALLRLVIDTANGALSLNEKNNYSGIAIWKTGVTL